ncbi:MAG: ABC transporter substrate-binding protein, partial [Planctomycetes bacterium]|nr:ABC transporter substrate-binding protein [Planctomycetota bacterium]
QVDAIRGKWRGSPGAGIMIVVSRALGEGEPKDIYAAGPGTFYHDLLEILGARNACGQMKIKYPKISRESLLRLNPDVIIDLLTDMDTRKGDIEGAKRDWDNMTELAAVKNHRVCIITGSYAVVPGPRFVKLVEKIGETVNADK